MKQKVNITRTEVYKLTVEVEAATPEEALEVAKANYEDNDYYLMFDSPDEVSASFANEGEGGAEEGAVSNKAVDEMGDRLYDVWRLLREARAMAFKLAKGGDRRVLQLRGAASGLLNEVRETDGFLTGLAECYAK